MTAVANFSFAEIGLGLIVAVAAEFGGLLLLRTGGGTALRADISDERARPMSVAITPIVDDDPAPEARFQTPAGSVARSLDRAASGGAHDPQRIPEPLTRHPRRTPFPPWASPTRGKNRPAQRRDHEANRSQRRGSDAGRAPCRMRRAPPTASKKAPRPTPKAHAVSLYRAQLDRWFSAKFAIRGKIPFGH